MNLNSVFSNDTAELRDSEFVSLIFPGVRASSNSISSPPVTSRATLGFLYTNIFLIPSSAINPIDDGLSSTPLFRAISPFFISSPSNLRLSFGLAGFLILTIPSFSSVSSIITTESAPRGTGAPVIIFTVSF